MYSNNGKLANHTITKPHYIMKGKFVMPLFRRSRKHRHHTEQPSIPPLRLPLPQKKATDTESLLQRVSQTGDISTLRPPQILQLQRTLGNQVVQRMIAATRPAPTIQRFPTAAWVRSRSGGEKRIGKKKTKFGGSYENIISAIKVLDNCIDQNLPNTLKALATSLADVLANYDKVENTIQTYLHGQEGKGMKHVSKTRTNLANNLLAKIATERRIIAQAMLQFYMTKMPLNSGLMKDLTIRTFLNQYVKGNDRIAELSPQNIVKGKDGKAKTVGGGINTLTEVQHGKESGYFKPNIDNVSYKDRTNMNIMHLPPDQTLWDMTKVAGIHSLKDKVGNTANSLRMANRDVAMSRLDQLLDANLIARSEKMMMVMTKGSKPTEGVWSKMAKGEQVKPLHKKGKLVDNKKPSIGQVDIRNPNLQRLLSRLQLLDTLALQVDRNQANYFLELSKDGKVVGLTGIDNDLSMGKKDNIKRMIQEYPSLSMYVDKELAERIIKLDPNVLRVVMADLLTKGEIDALISRLTKLKTHLSTLQSANKLLSPTQWNEETAKKIFQERKSYYSRLAQSIVDKDKSL